MYLHDWTRPTGWSGVFHVENIDYSSFTRQKRQAARQVFSHHVNFLRQVRQAYVNYSL